MAIFAGSDTTSTVLAGIFFYLLANRQVFDELRKEVDETFPPGEGEPFDSTRLSEMPILNAVMCVFASLNSSETSAHPPHCTVTRPCGCSRPSLPACNAPRKMAEAEP